MSRRPPKLCIAAEVIDDTAGSSSDGILARIHSRPSRDERTDLRNVLLCFAAARLKTTPSALSIEQLDANLVLAFLEHLEKERGNCARTRNSRLAAIKTFFRFLEYRIPTCLDQTRRIRAIPVKKT